MVELGTQLLRSRQSVVAVLEVLNDRPIVSDFRRRDGGDRGIDGGEFACRSRLVAGVDIEADDVHRPGPGSVVPGDPVLKLLEHREGLAARIQGVNQCASLPEQGWGVWALGDPRLITQVVRQDGWMSGDR